MQIRYFAGAAEAAGVTEETLDDAALSIADLSARLAQGRERLARVLAVSAFLVDGRIAGLDDIVPAEARVDVLPPFAGG